MNFNLNSLSAPLNADLSSSPLPFNLGQHVGTHGGNITLGGGVGASNGFNIPGGYPDSLALFSQFPQLFSKIGGQATPTHSGYINEPSRSGQGPERAESPLGSRGAPSNKATSSAYASRHQAAEQRRRTRINERLDLLRKMVPHTDRANTASFLEEVLKYIDMLKAKVAELEGALMTIKGGKCASQPGTVGIASKGQDDDAAQYGQLNSFSLQNLHQQQQAQQIQQIQQIQQNEAALLALREEQQKQTAALLAHQVKQQRATQELEAARQSCHLNDLAIQLGLRTLQGNTSGLMQGMNEEQGVDALSMLANQASKQGHAGLLQMGLDRRSMLQSSVQQLLAVQGAGAPLETTAAAWAPKATELTLVGSALQPSTRKSGSSPASGEDSDVPSKKHKAGGQ